MGSKIQRNAPCPCGSGKKYKQCCNQLEKQKSAERAGYREGIQLALIWLSEHYKSEIDTWVDQTWLTGIAKEARQGIATAEPQIRRIHDINLLEFLVAEGALPETEGESHPLELILEANDLHLDLGQQAYLKQLGSRPLHLYRITACTAGKSFSLVDCTEVDSKATSIEDKWGSRMFDEGDIVGLRLLDTGKGWETSGAIYHIPDDFTADLQAKLAQAKTADYSRTLAHAWLELVAAHA